MIKIEAHIFETTESLSRQLGLEFGAQGVAEKARIEAQGKADAITIEAKAQAKANDIISKSLTTKLLHLEQIKVQGKFNEALQVNNDAKIFLTPGGSTPNIWVDTKDPQKRVSTAR